MLEVWEEKRSYEELISAGDVYCFLHLTLFYAMKYTIANKHKHPSLLSGMHLEVFPTVSICSWPIVLPFIACHLLLIGSKCDACGFDCITGRPHRATAAKYSYGKGPLGSRYESCMAFSWSLSSFIWFWIELGISYLALCGFHNGECEAQFKQRCKGCREKQKLRTQTLCKETLLGAAVTAF